MASILDSFFDRIRNENKSHLTDRPVQAARQGGDPFRGAIEAFANTEGQYSETGRRRGESALEWERRMRDSEKDQAYHREPLQAQSYSIEDYERDADAVETRVDHHENIKPEDYQWSGAGVLPEGQDLHHELNNVEVDQSFLRMSVQKGMLTPDQAKKIQAQGGVKGISSADWTSSPKVDEYDY